MAANCGVMIPGAGEAGICAARGLALKCPGAKVARGLAQTGGVRYEGGQGGGRAAGAIMEIISLSSFSAPKSYKIVTSRFQAFRPNPLPFLSFPQLPHSFPQAQHSLNR